MPFLLLFVLMLACLPGTWPEPAPWIGGVRGSFLLTWLSVAGVLAAARAIAWWTTSQLAQHPGQRETIIARYVSARTYHTIALFLTYAMVLYGLGWGWAVQCLTTVAGAAGEPSWSFPGAELIILAPFLVGLVGSWFFHYDAERGLHDSGPGAEQDPYWTRRTYLSFHLRQNMALVPAPVILLILADSITHLWPNLEHDPRFQVFALLLLGAVFAAMPWVLRLVLGLRPLKEGPLRQRLLATADRLQFRFTDILVWDTHSGVANAMVVGILPWLRYVLLTDRLIEELTPAEIEAVFGHEVGHIKHRHMLYYLGFLLVSLCVVSELWRAADLENLLHISTRQDVAILPRIALFGSYVFVVFGFVSRRCERQADIYGCRAVSCVRQDCFCHDEDQPLAPQGQGLCPTGICTFISALEKVAYLNGMSRERPGWLQSWQHSTIARRVDFLERILGEPALEPRFQRTVFLTKLALLSGLILVLLVLGRSQGWTTILTL